MWSKVESWSNPSSWSLFGSGALSHKKTQRQVVSLAFITLRYVPLSLTLWLIMLDFSQRVLLYLLLRWPCDFFLKVHLCGEFGGLAYLNSTISASLEWNQFYCFLEDPGSVSSIHVRGSQQPVTPAPGICFCLSCTPVSRRYTPNRFKAINNNKNYCWMPMSFSSSNFKNECQVGLKW